MFLPKILTSPCTNKHIYCYCFQPFSTREILGIHVNDCFKTNDKCTIKMAKKGETIKFRNYTRKTNSPLMIYTDFEGILLLENNGKQNPDESYVYKYQCHVWCSCGYIIACVDDQLSKPLSSRCYSKMFYWYGKKKNRYCRSDEKAF